MNDKKYVIVASSRRGDKWTFTARPVNDEIRFEANNDEGASILFEIMHRGEEFTMDKILGHVTFDVSC